MILKMKLNEKDISFLNGLSQIAGIFAIVVAFAMIFSLIQLKTINPLDNPVILSIKEQYDKDPANAGKAEQVRAIDLMARKAYFAARRQAETGSYLLLAGAVIFIFCQRLIEGNKKIVPATPGIVQEESKHMDHKRKYLLFLASFLSISALISSLILRKDLPDLSLEGVTGNFIGAKSGSKIASFKPGKTNFPFFRGENGRGIAGGSGYPTEWNGTTGKNIKWKTLIPKNGKSSPVIWGDKIYITGAEGTSCEVYCIDKNTGKILWSSAASGIPGEPSELPEMDQEGGLAVPSAATNGKYVCAVFANGNIVCLDADGKQKWAKNPGTPKSTYGYSSSLIIYDDLLIVQYDSDKKLSLMGFDIKSGTLKWETTRKGRPSWSSPVIASFNGKPQIVINGNPFVSSYDPFSGAQLWSVECMTGDVAPSLAINNTMAYAVTDYAKLTAIKSGINASIVWEDNTFTPDVSSPVATDELLFLSTGNGDVACYNSIKGDTLWTHYFVDPFYASPIIADGMVFFLDRSGTMHIVKEEANYKFISESPLGERVDCTPAFSDKNIYIRGKKNLYCISKE
jgi:outer membrane protein assembly factor BamB